MSYTETLHIIECEDCPCFDGCDDRCNLGYNIIYTHCFCSTNCQLKAIISADNTNLFCSLGKWTDVSIERYTPEELTEQRNARLHRMPSVESNDLPF